MLDKLYLELTDNQLETLHSGLKLALEFSCIGNFTNGVKRLVNFAYVDKDVLHPYWGKYAKEYEKILWHNKTLPEYSMNAFEDCAEWWDDKIFLLIGSKDQYKKDQLGRRHYTINLNDGTEKNCNGLFTAKLKLDTFPLLLDLIIRLSLGQIETMWTVVNGIIDVKTKKPVNELFSVLPRDVETYRDRMFTIFPMMGSLGIGSEKLTDNVKSLYEIYKAFQYEYHCYGVDSYGPIKISHTFDPLPVFGFEEQFICDYTEDVTALEEAYKNSLTNDYKILRSPIIDDGTLYFPVGDYSGTTYQRMKQGQKLYRKVNGYYTIR